MLVLYRSTCSSVLSESGTFISLHSTMRKGTASRYTTISKRFFMSLRRSCFSTAINEARYFSTCMRYNKKFCRTHSSGVMSSHRLRMMQKITSRPSVVFTAGFCGGKVILIIIQSTKLSFKAEGLSDYLLSGFVI